MYLYEHGFGRTLEGFADRVESGIRKAQAFKRPKFKMSDGGRSGAQGDEVREDRKEEKDAPLEGEVFYVDENKRMDEILKKVSRDGINSLSDSERRFLLQASDKIRRRRGGF